MVLTPCDGSSCWISSENSGAREPVRPLPRGEKAGPRVRFEEERLPLVAPVTVAVVEPFAFIAAPVPIFVAGVA